MCNCVECQKKTVCRVINFKRKLEFRRSSSFIVSTFRQQVHTMNSNSLELLKDIKYLYTVEFGPYIYLQKVCVDDGIKKGHHSRRRWNVRRTNSCPNCSFQARSYACPLYEFRFYVCTQSRILMLCHGLAVHIIARRTAFINNEYWMIRFFIACLNFNQLGIVSRFGCKEFPVFYASQLTAI